jgi:hypothetical protein
MLECLTLPFADAWQDGMATGDRLLTNTDRPLRVAVAPRYKFSIF